MSEESQNVTVYVSNLPPKSVIIWYGTETEIPKGWAICNGKNGTPNLIDRFVMGLEDESKHGETGGNLEISLDVTQMPAHEHKGKTSFDGIHKHEMGTRGFDTSGELGADGSMDDSDISTLDAGEHQHDFTTDKAGGAETIDILPPYCKLYYIMKLMPTDQ